MTTCNVQSTNKKRRVRQHYDPQGVIRLEVDEKACKTPSFRCDSMPYHDEEEQDAEEPRP